MRITDLITISGLSLFIFCLPCFGAESVDQQSKEDPRPVELYIGAGNGLTPLMNFHAGMQLRQGAAVEAEYGFGSLGEFSGGSGLETGGTSYSAVRLRLPLGPQNNSFRLLGDIGFATYKTEIDSSSYVYEEDCMGCNGDSSVGYLSTTQKGIELGIGGKWQPRFFPRFMETSFTFFGLLLPQSKKVRKHEYDLTSEDRSGNDADIIRAKESLNSDYEDEKEKGKSSVFTRMISISIVFKI